jgi:predicted transcriptional regulator
MPYIDQEAHPTWERGAPRDLRGRRQALKLSRVAVATLASCSPAHVGQIEAGYRPKRGDAVERIAEVLDRAEREVPQ